MTKNINNRKIKYNLSDLIDRLSIDQIKQIEFEKSAKEYENSLNKIMTSINIDLQKKNYKVNDLIINLLIALSQINLYIWFLRKDIAKKRKSNSKAIKLSHQLNAIRNQLKNKLLNELNKDKDSTQRKTNTNREDLIGWQLSVLND